MKKRIALLLCLVMLAGTFAGCDVNIDIILSFLPGFGTTQPTEPTNPTEPADPWAQYECITIAEALELCGAPGNITTARYYIRGTVVSIDNATYGAMTVKDETGTISVYNSTDANNVPYAQMEEKPYKDDEVLLHCILQNHNGTKEVKQAHIISFIENKVTVDEGEYPYYTIDTARETAKGTKLQVEGVVARITYANGMIPSGVMLVDHTGSIYIYDGDLAARVSIGNYISVLAEKDYWILDTETNNAAKFGYQGCNQLTNATLVSNDGGNNDFETFWMENSTVKEIIDTPVNVDISTKIFKVTALVKKVPGSGYVNYYFFDLDGTTGTYTYTQCNGSDFAWLDEFDGKICTAYLTALNAKSTVSDCYWRLLPVDVVDEGFDPATVNAAEHGVKYYGIGQFQTSYTGNPALELLTSVNAELLGFEGIALSYKSSDPSVISVDGNVMNCLKSGTATITITGTYGEQTYSADVTITVTIQEDTNTYATVKDAIDAAVGETVEVKGIVGPSLVNKVGFYLIDETGVIAVETTADVMETLEIGHEVVLSATRAINTKGGTNYYGQTCLKSATVVVNNYGTHEYSTAAFKGNLTVAEFASLSVMEDHSTDVYTVTATIKVVATTYYTNVYLTDGTNDVILYAGNGKTQHAWLIGFDGQEITLEVAPCNWNDKTSYAGCVLAVVNEDGTKTLNTLNFN